MLWCYIHYFEVAIIIRSFIFKKPRNSTKTVTLYVTWRNLIYINRKLFYITSYRKNLYRDIYSYHLYCISLVPKVSTVLVLKVLTIPIYSIYSAHSTYRTYSTHSTNSTYSTYSIHSTQITYSTYSAHSTYSTYSTHSTNSTHGTHSAIASWCIVVWYMVLKGIFSIFHDFYMEKQPSNLCIHPFSFITEGLRLVAAIGCSFCG